MEFSRISVVGAGNLAAHLVPALASAGVTIVEVISRSMASASLLAEPLGIPCHTDFMRLSPESQAVILAVPDDAIVPVLAKTGISGKVMIHTSGSVPVSVFDKYAEAFGVFYPLQTFTRDRKVGFSDIPVFVEASGREIMAGLKQLAGRISTKVHEADSDTRRLIHLAAVFACNFPNHLYLISKVILEKNHLGFDILAPLIRETSVKALEMGPELAQTGPALRNDSKVLKKHLEMLSSQPEWKAIYMLVSEDISRQHQSLKEHGK